MNISTLQFYKEIVESMSISKVAQNGHISQSALSQNIQKLESELGYQLLNRSNKGVYPTEMGKIVYKYSGTIIRIFQKMEDELESRKQKLENVRINGYPSFINYSLPCILYKIKKKFPEYKFELHSKSVDETFNDLINEVTDIAFLGHQPDDDRLISNYIGNEKIVLAASIKSRIPDVIKVEDLLKYDMIILDDSFPINNFLKAKLHHQNFGMEDLKVIFEVDSIGAAKSSINNNNCLSFLPYMSVKKELYEKSYKIVEIEDFDLDLEIYLSYKKNSNHMEALKPIIDYFIKSGTTEFC